MKRIIYFACLSLLVAGCEGPQKEVAKDVSTEGAKTEVAATPMKLVTAEELKEKMAGSPSLMVVNVLSKEAYQDCCIKGSINVPLNELEEVSKAWDKDREIIVYCSGTPCEASKAACEQLTKAGFTNVLLYEGGMKDWYSKKFDTTGECKADSLK